MADKDKEPGFKTTVEDAPDAPMPSQKALDEQAAGRDALKEAAAHAKTVEVAQEATEKEKEKAHDEAHHDEAHHDEAPKGTATGASSKKK
jgi:hypothetical protein